MVCQALSVYDINAAGKTFASASTCFENSSLGMARNAKLKIVDQTLASSEPEKVVSANSAWISLLRSLFFIRR